MDDDGSDVDEGKTGSVVDKGKSKKPAEIIDPKKRAKDKRRLPHFILALAVEGLAFLLHLETLGSPSWSLEIFELPNVNGPFKQCKYFGFRNAVMPMTANCEDAPFFEFSVLILVRFLAVMAGVWACCCVVVGLLYCVLLTNECTYPRILRPTTGFLAVLSAAACVHANAFWVLGFHARNEHSFHLGWAYLANTLAAAIFVLAAILFYYKARVGLLKLPGMSEVYSSESDSDSKSSEEADCKMSVGTRSSGADAKPTVLMGIPVAFETSI